MYIFVFPWLRTSPQPGLFMYETWYVCKRAEAGILRIRSGIFLRCAVAGGRKLTSTAMQKNPNGYADISRRPTAAL